MYRILCVSGRVTLVVQSSVDDISQVLLDSWVPKSLLDCSPRVSGRTSRTLFSSCPVAVHNLSIRSLLRISVLRCMDTCNPDIIDWFSLSLLSLLSRTLGLLTLSRLLNVSGLYLVCHWCPQCPILMEEVVACGEVLVRNTQCSHGVHHLSVRVDELLDWHWLSCLSGVQDHLLVVRRIGTPLLLLGQVDIHTSGCLCSDHRPIESCISLHRRVSGGLSVM